MKKLSILLVCCLLVGCSNKLKETSTPSIEETMQPTTIIETTTETTEQIILYSLYDNTLMYVEESVDSQIIDALEKGEAVTLLTSNDKFAKIRKENGLLGYVPLEMLSETDPTAISVISDPTSETMTETSVNEDIIRLESEVAELESKVSELESKLAETSVEKTVEETTKETKPPKETVVVVVTASPTPTPEPTPEPIKDVYVTVIASEGRISASNKIRQALEDAGWAVGGIGDITGGVIPGESQLKMNPGSYVLDLDICTVHITVVE